MLQLEQREDDGPVAARAFSTGPVDALAERLHAAACHAVAAHDDLRAFRAAVAGDPPMAGLADRLRGLKPLRTPDLWTVLLRALIRQQAGAAQARRVE